MVLKWEGDGAADKLHRPELFGGTPPRCRDVRKLDRQHAAIDVQNGDRYADKILVIPNPVSWERLEAPCSERDALRVPTSPYILSVAAHYLRLPVVTTRRASLPETTLGLATYVDDPLSADELDESINGILAAPSAYRPPEDARRSLRLTYSPEAVARAYYSVLA